MQKNIEESIIAQIFYGNVGHQENVKMSKEYSNIMNKIIEYDEKMRTYLKSDSEKVTLYENLTTTFDKLNLETALSYYEYGFKLGAKLVMEILENS